MDVQIRVRVDASDDRVRLWWHPDKLAVAPAAMDEQRMRWIFPRRIDLSETEVERVLVDGVRAEWEWTHAAVDRRRDTAGRDWWVRVPPGPARTVQLSFHVRFRVPERFGRLGRVGGRLSLLAPWYPLIVDRDGGTGHDVLHHVRVSFSDARDVLLAGRVSTDIVLRTPYVPLFAAERLHRIDGHAGTGMWSASPWYVAPNGDAEGLYALADLARSDRAGPIRRALRDVHETAALAEVAEGLRVPEVVIGTSRTELAGTAPGFVMLSDRAFEIFPVEEVREFHTRAVRRAMFRALVAPASRARDGVLDALWSADLRAVLLTDLDARRRRERVRTPQELLGWAGFNPAIDQLLYAPQVAFVDAYFAGVGQPDLFREDPAHARRRISRGRRLVEYMRDHLAASPVGGRVWFGAMASCKTTTNLLVSILDRTL